MRISEGFGKPENDGEVVILDFLIPPSPYNPEEVDRNDERNFDFQKKIKNKQTKQNKETLLVKTDLSREARDLKLTSDCYFYSNGEEEGSHSI